MRTRFQRGTSGNPSGRPKRRPTFRSVLMDELAAPVPSQGSQPAVSKLQALVKTLVAAAIAGNARAQALLVGAIAQIGESDDQEAASLTPEDSEIWKHMSAANWSGAPPTANLGYRRPTATQTSNNREARQGPQPQLRTTINFGRLQ